LKDVSDRETGDAHRFMKNSSGMAEHNQSRAAICSANTPKILDTADPRLRERVGLLRLPPK
jgi:hypothetical protein